MNTGVDSPIMCLHPALKPSLKLLPVCNFFSSQTELSWLNKPTNVTK